MLSALMFLIMVKSSKTAKNEFNNINVIKESKGDMEKNDILLKII
jgi:hypothetical protein